MDVEAIVVFLEHNKVIKKNMITSITIMIIHMVLFCSSSSILIMVIPHVYSKNYPHICPRDNDCQHHDYPVNPPQTPLPLLTTETSWLGGRTLKVIVIVINTILFLISIAINITIDIVILIVTLVIILFLLFSDPKQGRVSKPSEGRWTGKSHRPKQ